MLDDDCKEVVDAKEYKCVFHSFYSSHSSVFNRYFGRTKELPSVRNLSKAAKKKKSKPWRTKKSSCTKAQHTFEIWTTCSRGTG